MQKRGGGGTTDYLHPFLFVCLFFVKSYHTCKVTHTSAWSAIATVLAETSLIEQRGQNRGQQSW